MATILIVDSDPVRATALRSAFASISHKVEWIADSYAARERLSGPEADLMIVDASTPDDGTGLLMAQAHFAWPLSRTLAMIRPDSLERCKLVAMGLWCADHEELLPFDTGAVSFAAHRLLRESRQASARRAAERGQRLGRNPMREEAPANPA